MEFDIIVNSSFRKRFEAYYKEPSCSLQGRPSVAALAIAETALHDPVSAVTCVTILTHFPTQ